MTVGGTEKQYIYLIQRMSLRKHKVGLTEKSPVNCCHRLPGVTRGMHKSYLHLRVVDKNTKELAGSVAGASYYTYFFFTYSAFPFLT